MDPRNSVVIEFINSIFLNYSPQYNSIKDLAKKDLAEEFLSEIEEFLSKRKEFIPQLKKIKSGAWLQKIYSLFVIQICYDNFLNSKQALLKLSLNQSRD